MRWSTSFAANPHLDVNRRRAVSLSNVPTGFFARAVTFAIVISLGWKRSTITFYQNYWTSNTEQNLTDSPNRLLPNKIESGERSKSRGYVCLDRSFNSACHNIIFASATVELRINWSLPVVWKWRSSWSFECFRRRATLSMNATFTVVAHVHDECDVSPTRPPYVIIPPLGLSSDTRISHNFILTSPTRHPTSLSHHAPPSPRPRITTHASYEVTSAVFNILYTISFRWSMY